MGLHGGHIVGNAFAKIVGDQIERNTNGASKASTGGTAMAFHHQAIQTVLQLAFFLRFAWVLE